MQSLPKVRVTILEDQLLLRESLQRVLEDGGLHVVSHYGDPSEFLARVVVDAPRVAVVDLGLMGPGGTELVDGLSVVRELRNRHLDVQALVFSGHAEPETVARCFHEGAAGFLDKLSADGNALVEAVHTVARGERFFPNTLFGVPAQTQPLPPGSPLLQSLSPREREVLGHVAAGADNLKIAALLHISERTVKAHMASLYRKLPSENRTQLALCALQLGVRPPFTG